MAQAAERFERQRNNQFLIDWCTAQFNLHRLVQLFEIEHRVSHTTFGRVVEICVHGAFGYRLPSGAVLVAIGKPFCCCRQRVISYMFEELALLRTRGLGSHHKSYDLNKPGYIMKLGDVFCTLYDMTQTHPQI